MTTTKRVPLKSNVDWDLEEEALERRLLASVEIALAEVMKLRSNPDLPHETFQNVFQAELSLICAKDSIRKVRARGKVARLLQIGR